MRTVFQQLDTADSGIVPLPLLLQCFGNDGRQAPRIRELLERGVGLARLNGIVAQMKRRMKAGMSDCTWGEVCASSS